MNLEERIERRRRSDGRPTPVTDYDAISPVSHPDEPTGRGPVLERLLDHLDPAFEGRLPENAYLWGPKGAGKSAVVSALFAHLAALTRQSRSPIPTATRVERPAVVDFVYADVRTAESDFALYHAVLDDLTEDRVPEQGVGTAQLRSRLRDRLAARDRGVVVCTDHVGEPETHSLSAVADLLDPVSPSLSWLAVGRRPPAEVEAAPEVRVEVEAYRRHALMDVLTARTSRGLGRHALVHDQLREVATWADGDAHDALAAVFGAADRAARSGASGVADEHLEAGMADVPRPCVSLGRVLALAENRRRVLYGLVSLDPDRMQSVGAAAESVAATEVVDLSAATVERILYELAEAGVIRRVSRETSDGMGRPPSRLEPRFPTSVFRQLYALTANR